MTSRRHAADLRPSPETASKPLPGTARELFDALPQLPGLRTEVIDGRLIVSPVGTPEHGWLAMLLSYELYPLVLERDWQAYAGNVDVCIDGPRDPVEPDFVLAPADCPRWGDRELLSSGLIMVAEVVSPGSVVDDRDRKPDLYAGGLVPVMLLVDPVAAPATVTVFSDPKGGEYQTVSRVSVGSPLRLPDPVGFTLETSVFEKALGNP
ncbi:Uma2 family endonuclease [Streptosporangium sp. NBC_01756]|uniref:Uma2 family endonuclease n=1 Tax=Streptosporangium sp. NBC_01756 TaxID=2975950 RepID=UPI002DDC0F5C|nr:Uma2 family endonuclease [Streptosporangium sp. NBC_01756]WSC83962.1 Uma2 family endonuclease [Streptosporangium sp. NBC_01756]